MDEIRLYLCEILIGFILKIVPSDTTEGLLLLKCIREYAKNVKTIMEIRDKEKKDELARTT